MKVKETEECKEQHTLITWNDWEMKRMLGFSSRMLMRGKIWSPWSSRSVIRYDTRIDSLAEAGWRNPSAVDLPLPPFSQNLDSSFSGRDTNLLNIERVIDIRDVKPSILSRFILLYLPLHIGIEMILRFVDWRSIYILVATWNG